MSSREFSHYKYITADETLYVRLERRWMFWVYIVSQFHSKEVIGESVVYGTKKACKKAAEKRTGKLTPLSTWNYRKGKR